MTRDALSRMDVDTHWVHHRRWARLQRRYPDDWQDCAVAYFALLGAAWSARNRDVNLEDGWPVALRADLDTVRDRLREAGLIDGDDCIPATSWEEWYGPAAQRIATARHAAGVRWGSKGSTQPASQPEQPDISARARKGETTKGPVVPMKEAMKAAGWDPDQLPGGADKGG